ncbi:MAG: carbohydrate kinase family protein [Actinomycetota bacterium]|nr:carbohydrate kinase family protein [Actinomycetota bacterium]
MGVVVTGSIANDYLMTFPGRFAELIVPEQIGRLSLSFLVDELEVRRGGVAANICFGMAQLGLRPVLVGAVGHDFADYRAWLERHGIDTASVHVSEFKHTARFLCTTDVDQSQIASFYAGAMEEARQIELAPVASRLGGVDLVVVSPNDPAAMVHHTEEARRAEIPFVADPSQQLARMSGSDIRALIEGAAYLVMNDYERSLLEAKTGWSHADVLARVAVCVTTLGEQGCVIERFGKEDMAVPAVPATVVLDPTGVGDAFRAGFIAGRLRGLSLERAAQLGCALATLVLEAVGTQEYTVESESFLRRIGAAYGQAAAGEVAATLPSLNPES